jgi:hypothetical protein
MQAEAQDVHRRVQERRIDPGEQRRNRRVRLRHAPVPVDRERGEGLVAPENQFDRARRCLHLRIVWRAVAIGRGVARSDEQRVALAQRPASCSARRTTMSRLGMLRPDSMKLRWRCDTSASAASASWLSDRRRRQSRRIAPKEAGEEPFMPRAYTAADLLRQLPGA